MKKNGEIITVRLSVSQLHSSNGEYKGRSILKDYTEFKRLQAQIDQSEKLAVIGQLAAGVAIMKLEIRSLQFHRLFKFYREEVKINL